MAHRICASGPGLTGHPVSFFYHRNIIGRMVFPDTCNQLLIQLIRTRKILHLLTLASACLISSIFPGFVFASIGICPVFSLGTV